MDLRERNLQEAKLATSATPSTEQLDLLSHRIEVLQQSLGFQGLEHQAHLKNAERAHKLQLVALKSKMQQFLFSKQLELNQYKAQLVAVLETASMLKQNLFS